MCDVLGNVADLPPRVLRGGDIEVVGQPPPRQLGVARLLVEAVATESKGVIHGDPLGTEHREGISQAGGGLGVAAGEYGLTPVVELDDEVAVVVDAPAAVRRTLEPYLESVEAETRSKIDFGPIPPAVTALEVDLDSGAARVGLLSKAVDP